MSCFFVPSYNQIHWFGSDSEPTSSRKAFGEGQSRVSEALVIFLARQKQFLACRGRFLPHPPGIDFTATTLWKAGQPAGYPAEFAKIALGLISSTANSDGLERQLSTVNTT